MLCSNGSKALTLKNSKKPPSASMLCSSSAKDNLQCTRTAVIRGQPYSVAVVPKLSHSNKERTFKRKHCLRSTDLYYRRTCSYQSKPMSPCSVTVVLNAVGDPRSFPTCKQDDFTQCICMLFSSALLKSGPLSGSSSACS